MKKLIVNQKYNEKKLNKFLLENIPNLTYGLFCNTLRKKDIKVNGKRINKDIILYNGDIVLADEISPDTCRFWDATTGEKLDKDRFRRDLGNVKDAYVEILKRIQE